MNNKNKYSKIDELVDTFGYDYTIGYCLCTEYEMEKQIKEIEDEELKKKRIKSKGWYRMQAERLMRERVSNGL